MPAYWKGMEITGPRGPAGPDGNPIGTVISYMGTKAPKDYLICDGAEYSIFDYSKLAEFFREQFGAANYFGGDGETTFAVPDMRNLFLRGYRGEAEEQLSGGIGERQEATEFPYLMIGNSSNPSAFVGFSNSKGHTQTVKPENVDYKDYPAKLWQGAIKGSEPMDDLDEYPTAKPLYGAFYTARPLNMAVLYCIKATHTDSAEFVTAEEMEAAIKEAIQKLQEAIT